MPATLVVVDHGCADQDAQGKIAVGGEATRPQNQRQEGERDGEQRGGAWQGAYKIWRVTSVFGRAPDLTSRRAAVTVSVEPGANINP